MGRFSAILVAAAALGAAGCNTSSVLAGPSPAPLRSIAHVVILMQENRSFDNLFAGFPGADTVLEGKCAPEPWCKSGTAKLHPVALKTGQLGLGTDIDHSHRAFEIEYDGGKMDGFDKIRFGAAGQGKRAKLYPYAFVTRSEITPYWDLAKEYGIADHMFFTDTAASFIAHQVILSGTVRLNASESETDQPDQEPWGCDAPPGTVSAIIKTNGKVDEFGGPYPCFTQWGTLADLLDAANVSWKYYVAPISGGDFSGGVWDGFDAIAKVRCKAFTPPENCRGYGADWNTHVVNPNTKVFSDLKNGTLPALSWVIPTLADSDHPASGCDHGPRWIASVVDAIGQSRYWKNTAIVLLWDDWGGWYDNVPPPQTNYTSLGFRVPMIVISPYAKPHYVSHTQYEYGSILQYVEQNFNLGSLHTTDESANSMDDMFDYAQKPTAFSPEPLPHVKSCGNSPSAREIIEHDGGVPE